MLLLRSNPGCTLAAARPRRGGAAARPVSAACSSSAARRPRAVAARVARPRGGAEPRSEPERTLDEAQLTAVAAEFVGAWFALDGLAHGGDESTALGALVAPGVVLEADPILRPEEVVGAAALLAELRAEHRAAPRPALHRLVHLAASAPARVAFVAVESTFRDAGPREGHPATFRVSRIAQLLKLKLDRRERARPACGRSPLPRWPRCPPPPLNSR